MIRETYPQELSRFDEVLVWDPEDRVLIAGGSELGSPLVFTDFRPSVVNVLSEALGHTMARHADEDEQFALLEDHNPDEASQPRPIDLVPGKTSLEAYLNTATMRWLAKSTEWEDSATEAMAVVEGYIRRDGRAALAGALGLNFNANDERLGVSAVPIEGTPEGVDLVVPRLWVGAKRSRLETDEIDRQWSEVVCYGGVNMYGHDIHGWQESLPLLAGVAAINTLIVTELLET